jgi:hypothetical protein
MRRFFQQMGNPLYSDDVGQMCFNPAKNFQLGWYNSHVITIDPRLTHSWSGTIVGIADFKNNPDDRPVVIKIETGFSRNHFIGFNRATGINSDNVEADDEVTITETGLNGRGFSRSVLLATMVQGESHTWTDWEGTGANLIVHVKAINLDTTDSGPGYADITISWDGPPAPPLPPPTTDVCRVFVTENVFDGYFLNQGDQTDNPIVNANQECQNRANAAGLQGQYKAWLSTGPTNFDTAGYSPVRNFVKCGSYVLPGGDGPDVAYDGFTGLTDGAVDNPINELANGDLVPDDPYAQYVWTGTSADGTLSPDQTCNDWSTDDGDDGSMGSALRFDSGWSRGYIYRNGCSFRSRIYCFEQGDQVGSKGGGANGDPHFKTWNGDHFDFQSACDLILLQSAAFGSGLGLAVHIRTTVRRDVAYISGAVLRIGTDVLEVESQGVYYFNGVAGADLPALFSGFAFSHTHPTNKQHVFEVHVGGRERIKVKTYKDFVSVLIEQGKSEHFHDSIGLMGDFTMGHMIARDGKTVIDDANVFGQEWQVLDTEPTLFQTVRFPQHPNICTMPTPVQASELRRRLSESSSVDQLAAEKACAHWGGGKDDCVFDVLATGDLEMAMVGAY